MPRDIAVDLGTANTLVFVRGRGIVLNEPTVVAMNERTGDVLAMGNEAWDVVGRSPGHIVGVRPLRHGAITDFDVTERLIRSALSKAGLGRFAHPRALVCVSSAITTVERRAVEEATLSAGARAVHLIEEPMAAAIGAGLPIDQPTGNCVIDIGGGTTEVAVVTMGGVVASRAIRVGGFDIDEAIQRFLRHEYGLAVAERTAEAIKKEVGSAYPTEDEPKAEIRGRELASGMPKTLVVSADEMRAACEEGVAQVSEAVRGALADTPPELAHDVIEGGMYLMGGGGLLRGMAARLTADTTIPVHLVERPLETVCLGAGRALESLDTLKDHGVLLS
ncbi:MAG TPA: rod shape-determining protein [Actinomycetota bacterium]|nr:rod shape-determining protein [Actinomycetota bacterium]